jgi:cell division protein FtsB
MKLKLSVANIINALGAMIVIYLAVVLINTVRRNYELDKQIAAAADENSLLQLQRDELSQSIVYYRTESFQERQARAKLGLQKPGENVVILPVRPAPSTEPAVKPAPERSNFQQWMDFLTGKTG